ncbi:hypothetical protein [Nostoc sp. GT001]|uniref:hypothetical protein n=1 Tax=Nostoc sp. GT001 TaxID=3056647 RepID=UPI0025AB067E|nr:hypothetical protein [Nostoc sp. GT001]MDM9583081.1 hypothetical protein [Nostoc sp. GT001]
MTQITGKFVDSGGVTFDGDLTVTLDAPLVDVGTTPDSIYTLTPHTFTFSSGTLSGVNVVESATSNVTYHFVVSKHTTRITYWLADGTQYDGPVVIESSLYYTGTFYDADTSQQLGQVTTAESSVVMDFHALVPNTSSVEFASLIPTRISTDSLPRAVRQLAELLTTDADFVEALRGGPRFKGAYSSATYYQRDDSVTYGGSSWVYINPDPAANQTPSLVNTAYWQILAQIGDPGGTGGNDTAYDATGWNGDTNAPSKNAVRDIIVQLATIAQLATYAPLDSPNLTGSPSRNSNPLLGDRSLAIPTTQWVGNEFATKDSPIFTNNPAAPTQAISDESNKLATTLYVKNKLASTAFAAVKTTDQALTAGLNILNFDSELLDTDNAFVPSTATFTAPTSGWYEFHASASIERTTGTIVSFFIGSIYVGATEYRLWQISGAETLMYASGTAQIYLVAASTAQFKPYVVSDGTTTNRNALTDIYMTRFSGSKLYW